MRKRRRRKKENGEGDSPKSFESLIGFNRPSYKYASQITERRRKGEAAREEGGSKGFDRPSYKYASQISERRSDGEADSRHLKLKAGSQRHGNGGKSDIQGKKVFRKVDSAYDSDGRKYERDYERGDYESRIYESGDPVSRKHDRDHESGNSDYRSLRHGNGGKSDIRGEKVFRKVDSAYESEDYVSRKYERDYESNDFQSHIHDSGDPVSRNLDRDHESGNPDHRVEAELTDSFEVEFGDWLSKFGVDRTTQSPPRRRRLTSDQGGNSMA